MALTFEWDDDKASTNIKKHGVSFAEAATVFGDSLSHTVFDPDHSGPGDERYILLGRSHRGRFVVVAHSERGDNIRIISARLATPRERTRYAEEIR